MTAEDDRNINSEVSSNNPEVSGKTVRAAKSRRKDKVKKGFYYSFLTLVLVFCILQVGFGAILNISKTISYKSKINTLEKVRDEAEARNQDLKDDIKQFSKTTSLEGIARNNLKMAGEDEVLVIINEPKKETEKDKKKK